jgi:tRNA-uridine 2-sulfurtransferase
LNNKKVILGMSGGIDSSLSALLLKEKGYEVIGITFKVFKCENKEDGEAVETSCCSIEGIEDAVSVARFLKIPHYTIDLSDEFHNIVVNDFINEYLSGRTPNPCIICNKEIKWSRLLKFANELDAGFIATGHYANIKYDSQLDRFLLSKAADPAKDQSYALWRLSQEQLSRTIFPLGALTKMEVRKIALELKLPVAKKKESFEICFIPDNDYGKYLKKEAAEKMKNIGNGDIIYHNNVIGKHRGYPFYTIGQRRGLGIALKEPVYVIRIDPLLNQIEVGTKEEVMCSYLLADNINIIKYNTINNTIDGTAKIRYKDSGTSASMTIDDNLLRVNFNTKKAAITPGQSIVFYENDDVVAGGVIREFK